ncbi:MAG: class I SAM-dependent methyltransferase [Cyanobacteria bacterium REEB494]|nr:class I SAM-dependent methyltransferase [Cyanobacteria bacterium REEB494]
MNHIAADFGEDWFNSPSVYKMLVKNCRDDGRIVELGAWKGRSSSFLVVEAYNKSPKIEIHIVDTWGDNPYDGSQDQASKVYEKFVENMAPLNGLFQLHRMNTADAANLFENKSLDGVFIDADHSYEAVKKDIQNWLPKIRKGGILAGHDYNHSWPGVIKAVDELLSGITIFEFCWIKQC